MEDPELVSLSMSRRVTGVTAVAVCIRSGCPAKPPSPTKSPGPRIATTASLPVLETTDSFTPPFWMYMTLPQTSPWEKMVSFRLYSTILVTPAESKKRLGHRNQGRLQACHSCHSSQFSLCLSAFLRSQVQIPTQLVYLARRRKRSKEHSQPSSPAFEMVACRNPAYAAKLNVLP